MQDGLMFTFGFIILAVYFYFMWTTKAQQENIERKSGLEQKSDSDRDLDRSAP